MTNVGSVKEAKKAKVAVYTCGIEPSSTETKGTVLIENAQDLMSYSEGEEKQLMSMIKSIKDTGVSVIVYNGTCTDMAKHFLDKFGILAIKISSQHDIRRMGRAVNATPMVKLDPPTAEEVGYCSHVFVREMGLDKITIFQQDDKDATQLATIVLRGSTQNILNDVERAMGTRILFLLFMRVSRCDVK